MTAAARQAIPVIRDEQPLTLRQSLFESWSSMLGVTDGISIVNERSMPGATEALRAWAEVQGYRVAEGSLPGAREASVRLSNGSTITVTNAKETTP